MNGDDALPDDVVDDRCDCFCCREAARNENNEERREDATFKSASTYAAKLALHEQLSPFLSITKFEVLTMILAIAVRHGMTGPLINDLLKFVNVLVGVECLPKSDYIFNKIFSVDSSLQYHFVCDRCNLYLGEHKSFNNASVVDCPNCNNRCKVKPSTSNEGTFFVTLSVRNQMEELIQKAGQHIVSRDERISDGFIRDIYDGQLYKSLCKEGMPLANPLALSVIIGTDGGQVFQTSCRNSMWPIQVICNELHPSERFRAENMMLAGLWFGKSSPEMSAFLKPLSDELKSMETNGVRRVINGEEVSCPVYTIMCVCDSVAKPKLQNIVQFNGYFGCGYCYQRGVLDEECGQVRFPFDENVKYPLRTEESVRKAMTLAQETSVTETGIKGLSPLLLFSTLHLVFGIPIDYMHAVLLGTVKRLVGFWFDETSSGKRYYIKKFEPEIDKILSNITLPSKIATRPKLISKRAQWKAKDYAAFLLHYGLPCLEKYLPSVYIENFRDLCNGIFLLLTDSISPVDLHEAHNYLSKFVKSFNLLYGTKNMVYNVHLLTHLVQIVKLCGPLPMYSAFSLENGMGLLIKLVKGTNSVASQISRKYIVCKSLPILLSEYDLSEAVLQFCEESLMYSKVKNSVFVDNITLLGPSKHYLLSLQDRHLLQQAGWNVEEIVETYHRTIFTGKVITSRDYARPTKTNDTCVQLRCGTYGVIDLIIYVTEPQACVIIFTPLRVCPDFRIANHLFPCAGKPFAPKIVVRPIDILRKCLFFSVETKKFVSYRANEFERD